MSLNLRVYIVLWGGGKDALACMLVGHLCISLFLDHERKMLLFSLPGHSWDRMGWIELRIALISTTAQTVWVSTEGPARDIGVGWGSSSIPPVTSTSVVIRLPV